MNREMEELIDECVDKLATFILVESHAQLRDQGIETGTARHAQIMRSGCVVDQNRKLVNKKLKQKLCERLGIKKLRRC